MAFIFSKFILKCSFSLVALRASFENTNLEVKRVLIGYARILTADQNLIYQRSGHSLSTRKLDVDQSLF